ncbi:hypothetical protein [Helicobacter cetorum]|uniref:hypothetical protein n=1 Tax=Helicobacter cetorum TaxID=138563 RepID=UPI001315A356|nr:hypothetical protein [Helicobacter cetorum]
MKKGLKAITNFISAKSAYLRGTLKALPYSLILKVRLALLKTLIDSTLVPLSPMVFKDI